MKPIRGPIDYNRYPPRERHAPGSAPDNAPDSPPRSRVASRDSQHAQQDARDFAATGAQAFGATNRDAEAFDSQAISQEMDAQAMDATAAQTPRATSGSRRGKRMKSRRDRAWRTHGAGLQRGSNVQGTSARRVRSGKRRVALWKRARRWAFLLFLVLVAQTGVATLTSSHFAIARVELQGLNITSESQVAPIQNALLGQNWLRAGLGQAKNELEKVPSIRGVEMTRMLAWPPQVLIRVSERQAFARVGAGQEWFVVDRDGVPFRVARAQDDALYAVTGPTLQPRLGHALSQAAWRSVRQISTALALSENEGEKWALRRLYFDRHGFASLRLTGGAQDETLVQLGADRWPEKLRRARQALAYFEATGRRASTLNLLSYSMPLWTPKAVATTPVVIPRTSQTAPQNTPNGIDGAVTPAAVDAA